MLQCLGLVTRIIETGTKLQGASQAFDNSWRTRELKEIIYIILIFDVVESLGFNFDWVVNFPYFRMLI